MLPKEKLQINSVSLLKELSDEKTNQTITA